MLALVENKLYEITASSQGGRFCVVCVVPRCIVRSCWKLPVIDTQNRTFSAKLLCAILFYYKGNTHAVLAAGENQNWAKIVAHWPRLGGGGMFWCF